MGEEAVLEEAEKKQPSKVSVTLGDDCKAEIEVVVEPDGTLSDEAWAYFQEQVDKFALSKGEWAGIPLPVSNAPLILEKRYPFQGLQGMLAALPSQQEPESEEEVITANEAIQVLGQGTEEAVNKLQKTYEQVKEFLYKERNSWYSYRLNADITILSVCGKSRFHVRQRYAMDRFAMMAHSMLACKEAHRLSAELKAMEKLKSLINETQYAMYVMTGCFAESSTRSKITYFFRKLRPTVAISRDMDVSGDGDKKNVFDRRRKFLAALCLHPIGYYGTTFVGTLVPTDDVIAHLLLMRSDEHYLWRKAYQHPIDESQAGI